MPSLGETLTHVTRAFSELRYTLRFKARVWVNILLINYPLGHVTITSIVYVLVMAVLPTYNLFGNNLISLPYALD